ncbi:MAG: hypothetical protein U5L02_17995 [Rheinheimera sp.]|nr:hypothetical protein [Rheinheimera sp.]
MLKLKWQHRLRLWAWQQRRLLILSGASLLAAVLLLAGNALLLSLAVPAMAKPLLTLGQLGIAGLLVTLVLIVSD